MEERIRQLEVELATLRSLSCWDLWNLKRIPAREEWLRKMRAEGLVK